MHFLIALFALLAVASGASAAELRPLGDSSLCLDAGVISAPFGSVVKIAQCDGSATQQFRKGNYDVVAVEGRCLQAIGKIGQPGKPVIATRCHAQTGQRWRLARDGQMVGDGRLCLAIEGKSSAGAGVITVDCKSADEDKTGQQWAIYGKF